MVWGYRKKILNVGKIALFLAFFGISENLYSQHIITGTVVDATDKSLLPGVNIMVKGTSIGTSTDVEGRYRFTVTSMTDTLVYSYIGYQRLELPIEDRSDIHVELMQEIVSGGELVVVGYGQQRRSTLTGSISSMPTRELVQSPVSNISNTLAGRLPGLFAVQSSGEPGFDTSEIRIRGIGSLHAGAESNPLILIDGVEQASGVMNQLDPNEIESVSILKDASSTAVYGVRGANGVILITTKRGETGRPQISYSSNTGVQLFTQMPQMLNSYEYATLRNEASINTGSNPYFSDHAIEMFRTGEIGRASCRQRVNS